MKIRLQNFSFRFAEQVLNSKLAIKQEIESVLTDPRIDVNQLSRPQFNKILDEYFPNKGWERQPAVFDEPGDPTTKSMPFSFTAPSVPGRYRIRWLFSSTYIPAHSFYCGFDGNGQGAYPDYMDSAASWMEVPIQVVE
jgi:hypothetical protein